MRRFACVVVLGIAAVWMEPGAAQSLSRPVPLVAPAGSVQVA